jgi:molybdenum cofactor cytidylyltransferase
MKFGRIPLAEAEGAVLAHGIRAGDVRLSKGRILSGEDLRRLAEAGVGDVVAATLEEGDVGEDEAARRIAAALRGRGFSTRPASTGRVNLHADAAGVFAVDAALINRLNAIDPAITLATLADHAVVERGRMVATVKIIPFAVAETAVRRAEDLCAKAEAFSVHAFSPRRAGLIQTRLSGTKPTVLDKTVAITAGRLARSGSRIVEERRTGHDADELAPAIRDMAGRCDLLIIFGASAISDRADVIPAAIEMAGGEVVRVGMPVDPGNLITLGRIGGKPVLGAPGCARSPKENGFDWVLDRLSAGIEVDADDIGGFGVGGLLMEIPGRPRPREAPEPAPELPRVHGLLLAAGQSRRMGGPNKLLARFDGEFLVRRAARELLAGGVSGVTVVTGHERGKIEAALAGIDVRFVHNPDFGSGLAGSLKVGLAAVPQRDAGALVALADMPGVTAADFRRLADAFAASGGGSIVRATDRGKRGNPVILPRPVFGLVAEVKGDTGARQIVESGEAPVVDVEIGEAASLDVDTPDRLQAAGGRIP